MKTIQFIKDIFLELNQKKTLFFGSYCIGYWLAEGGEVDAISKCLYSLKAYSWNVKFLSNWVNRCCWFRSFAWVCLLYENGIGKDLSIFKPLKVMLQGKQYLILMERKWNFMETLLNYLHQWSCSLVDKILHSVAKMRGEKSFSWLYSQSSFSSGTNNEDCKIWRGEKKICKFDWFYKTKTISTKNLQSIWKYKISTYNFICMRWSLLLITQIFKLHVEMGYFYQNTLLNFST